VWVDECTSCLEFSCKCRHCDITVIFINFTSQWQPSTTPWNKKTTDNVLTEYYSTTTFRTNSPFISAMMNTTKAPTCSSILHLPFFLWRSLASLLNDALQSEMWFLWTDNTVDWSWILMSFQQCEEVTARDRQSVANLKGTGSRRLSWWLGNSTMFHSTDDFPGWSSCKDSQLMASAIQSKFSQF
jgi:hypothetical protein